MQEGIEIIDKCVECGRTWDEDGQVQLSSATEHIINEFVCERCQEEED